MVALLFRYMDQRATRIKARIMLDPSLKMGNRSFSSLSAHAAPGNPGLLGAPSIPAYAATKGALETPFKHWAAMLGPRGIRVNGVAPGVIETDISNFTKTESGRRLALAMQALNRIGQPSDFADVIAFVASDGARWITGAN